MSLQTLHDSRHRISGTPVQKPLFFFPSTRRRLNMPRARRGLWRRERASIDASSMTVKPACNGKSRRKSSTMLLEWHPALRLTTGCRMILSCGTRSCSRVCSDRHAVFTVARARSLRVRLSRWRRTRSTRASRSVFRDQNECAEAERLEKVPVGPVIDVRVHILPQRNT